MAFLISFTTLFTFVLLIVLAIASYDPTSSTNVALYWGQGANQQRLLHYCQQVSVDIIPIAFMHVFPAQGNGWPGDNFGNQCVGGVYEGPGNNPSANQLQSQCPQLVADIPVCQSTYGKKIILSLGGSTGTYQLAGADAGTAFADFLWGAFGPQTASWMENGLPRPFDGPNNQSVEVDGFDFDIEYPSSDGSVGYIAMLTQLRNHFQSASKQYIITGAPQCIVPDANMGTMIAAVQFDIIWVQFYNTPYCSARAWVDANPSYTIPGPEAPSRFGYNDWVNFLVGTASANAKLYIGLPGSPSAAGAPSNYLNPTELSNIVAAYFCKPNFGGLMIWEATAAENNPDGPYYSIAKNILTGYVTNSALSCSGSSPSLSPSSGGGGVWVCMTISERSSAPTAPVTSLLTSNVKTSSTLQTLSSTAHKPASSGSPAKPTSPPAPAQGSISQDGSCGGANRYVCRSGNCCSQWGFCGVSDKYCGKGCQAAFGICS